MLLKPGSDIKYINNIYNYIDYFDKLYKLFKRYTCMKYFVGDIVKFQLESGEIREGNVRFIDMIHNKKILYINGFRGCAYKVPEENVISRSSLLKKLFDYSK